MTLTLRESLILSLMADGYSSKAIGRRLGLAKSTVDDHRSNTLTKLGALNAAHAVKLGICQGIIGAEVSR